MNLYYNLVTLFVTLLIIKGTDSVHMCFGDSMYSKKGKENWSFGGTWGNEMCGYETVGDILWWYNCYIFDS